MTFLKLDVEGYEHQALQGMDKLLAVTTRPVIFLEMSEMLQAAAQGRSSAVLDHLWDHQYQLFMAPTLTRRAAVPLKPLDHPEPAADGWMDALAVPAERMGELIGAARDGGVLRWSTPTDTTGAPRRWEPAIYCPNQAVPPTGAERRRVENHVADWTIKLRPAGPADSAARGPQR